MRLDPLQLLQAVHEISLLVDPDQPTKTTQRAFDTARSQSQRFPNVPRAKRITEQLAMPWSEVLTIAHEPESGHAQRLAYQEAEDKQDWLTEQYIGFVLRFVAERLGQKTIGPDEYSLERDRMLREDHKRWLHGRQLLLPTEMQIRVALANKVDRQESARAVKTRTRARTRVATAAERQTQSREEAVTRRAIKASENTTEKVRWTRRKISRTGAWNIALELAGLEARVKPGGSKKRAISTSELLERCYEIYNVQPTSGEVVIFASANSIPYSPTLETGKWSERVETWKSERRARGLETPDRPPPMDRRPDYTKDVGAARPGERSKQNWRKVENCVKYVVIYLEQLPAGRKPGQADYARWATTQTHAPYNKAFSQHGGWTPIRKLAQAQILRDQQPPKADPTHKGMKRSDAPTKDAGCADVQRSPSCSRLR